MYISVEQLWLPFQIQISMILTSHFLRHSCQLCYFKCLSPNVFLVWLLNHCRWLVGNEQELLHVYWMKLDDTLLLNMQLWNINQTTLYLLLLKLFHCWRQNLTWHHDTPMQKGSNCAFIRAASFSTNSSQVLATYSNL